MNTCDVLYDGPMHQRMTNPSDVDLRELIYSTDDDYWLAGSGEGELRFRSQSVNSHLGLKKVKPYGFRLLFTESDEGVMMVAISGESFEETVPVFSGGEFFDEPVALFFDEDTTYEIVNEFCRTGRRHPAVRWEEWTSVDWQQDLD